MNPCEREMTKVNHTDLILTLCLGVQDVADPYQLMWVYLFAEEASCKSDTKTH